MLSKVDKNKRQNVAPWGPGSQSTLPEHGPAAQPQAGGGNPHGDQQGQGDQRIEKYPAGQTPNHNTFASQGQAKANPLKCWPDREEAYADTPNSDKKASGKYQPPNVDRHGEGQSHPETCNSKRVDIAEQDPRQHGSKQGHFSRDQKKDHGDHSSKKGDGKYSQSGKQQKGPYTRYGQVDERAPQNFDEYNGSDFC